MIQSVLKQGLFWLRILQHAAKIWSDNNAFAHAGSLAFFTLFSIAPVFIVIVTIIGFFFGTEAAQGQIVIQLQETIGREAAEAVQTAVSRSRLDEGGLFATTAGIIAMLIGATTVFAQMQNSLNAIWEVVPKPTRSSLVLFIQKRITSLAIVVTVGFVMLVSLSLSVVLRTLFRAMEGWLPLYNIIFNSLEIILSLLIASVLFAAIFRVLPDVRLSWRDVSLGAVVTALLFTLGRSLIGLYLAYTATASTFGAAGSLVLLLLWVNYSSLILLYGAAFTKAHVLARGRTIRPSKLAVRVRYETIDE
jgi:membrane protein